MDFRNGALVPLSELIINNPGVLERALKDYSLTVFFNSNGGSGSATGNIPDILTGSTIQLPGGAGLQREGCRFEGWNTKADGTGTNYTAGSTFTVPEKNIVLYAKWAYTVRFNANDGTPAPADQEVVHGNKVTQPPTMTRNYHNFDGWYKEPTFTNRWNFTSDLVTTKDITLYAKWNRVVYSTDFKLIRESAIKITSSGIYNQHCDIVPFSTYGIDLNAMKQQGYQTVSFYIRLDVREYDDTTEYIYLFNSPIPTKLAVALPFYHTYGKKDTSWWRHFEDELKFENIPIDGFDNQFVFRYTSIEKVFNDWAIGSLWVRLVFN